MLKSAATPPAGRAAIAASGDAVAQGADASSGQQVGAGAAPEGGVRPASSGKRSPAARSARRE
jgi:hypothetical protein